MIDDRQAKNAMSFAPQGDAADARKPDRAPRRMSVVRRSNDPAAGMGEWVIDEVDS
jgi:hypothetical protein